MNRTARRTTLAALVALPIAMSALPASAGSSFLSRTTGRAASTSWVQVLDLTARGFGDVHVGFLSAYETSTGVADVFAWIDDYDCPPGELPNGGGHDQPSNCLYVGARQMQGANVPFTIDGRLATARLQGTLEASTSGHEGPGDSLGTVSADFVWTGTGDLMRSTSVLRYRDNNTSYSETLRTNRRAATMSGVLGPMLFEQAAQADGWIEEFRTKTQSRS